MQLKALGVEDVAAFPLVDPPPRQLMVRAGIVLMCLKALDRSPPVCPPRGSSAGLQTDAVERGRGQALVRPLNEDVHDARQRGAGHEDPAHVHDPPAMRFRTMRQSVPCFNHRLNFEGN